VFFVDMGTFEVNKDGLSFQAEMFRLLNLGPVQIEVVLNEAEGVLT
jgi:hypothetical protein